MADRMDVKDVPKLIESGFDSRDVLEPRYAFLGGMLVAVPITPWRQGSGEEPIQQGSKKVLPLMSMYVPVIRESDVELVKVPIIGGNGVFGALKNTIPNYMWEYYMNTDRNVLLNIYEESGVGVLAASLFRMKPPFLPAKYGVRPELVKAIWSNFIWTTWGIGIANWAPQRKFTATVLQPLFSDFEVLIEFTRYIANEAGITPPKPMPMIEGAGTPLSFEMIKLRRDLASDFIQLRGNVDFNRLARELAEIIGKEGKSEEAYDFTKPMPVSYIAAAPGTPLVSIFNPSEIVLYSDAEISTIALAVKYFNTIGPKENVFKTTTVFVFEDVNDGQKLVIGAEKYGNIRVNPIGKLEEYARMFEKWISKVKYDRIVVPIARALAEVAKSKR